MKVVIAPDSFKGSLTALEAARAMAAGVRRVWPDADIVLKPMADGGEGTLDILLAARKGERHSWIVTGANGAPMTAAYGIIEREGRRQAILEAAQVVGFNHVDLERDPVSRRTTRGIGELFLRILDQGLRDIVLAVGGTCTNDGGAGFLVALGARLLDACGQPVSPDIPGLSRLARLGFADLDIRVHRTKITLLSDVMNPLCGPDGASAVYGPQKGVQAPDLPVFDAALARLSLLGDAWANHPLSREPGAGSAGGLGYGAMLLGAQRLSGAQTVADWIGLPGAMVNANLVLTGEGLSDAQTLAGKVPMLVARLAERQQVPAMLFSGDIDPSTAPQLASHFHAWATIVSNSVSRRDAMRDAALLLTERVAHRLRKAQS